MRPLRGMPRTRAAAGAIGVDFDEEQVNLVQVRPARAGGFETVAAASLPYGDSRDDILQDPKRLKSLLARARRSGRFRGCQVNVSLPPDRVRTIPINYTVQSGEAEPAAFLRALAERVEDSLEHYIIDYIPIRLDKSAENRLAIAVLVDRAATLTFLDHLRQAGVVVRSLEIGPVALRRFVTALMGGRHDDVVMIVNFGTRGSYLTVLSGRRLVIDQQVDFGEAVLIERVAQALGVSEPEARQLIRRHGFDAGRAGDAADVVKTLIEITRPAFTRFHEQIDRAVVFAVSENRGRPVGRVYVGGSLARIEGTCELLGELLNLPIAPLPDPTAEFAAGTKPQAMQPQLAIAAGLALKGLVGTGDVELVPTDYRTATARRTALIRSATAGGAGLAACAVVVGTLITWTGGVEAEIHRLQQSQAVTENLRTRLAALESDRSRILQRADQLADLRRQSAGLALFQALDRAFVPGEMWLLDWSFSALPSTTPTSMTLRGEALHHAALSSFVRQLLADSAVSSIDIVRTAQIERDTGSLVGFEIEVVLTRMAQTG